MQNLYPMKHLWWQAGVNQLNLPRPPNLDLFFLTSNSRLLQIRQQTILFHPNEPLNCPPPCFCQSVALEMCSWDCARSVYRNSFLVGVSWVSRPMVLTGVEPISVLHVKYFTFIRSMICQCSFCVYVPTVLWVRYPRTLRKPDEVVLASGSFNFLHSDFTIRYSVR